MYDELTEVDIKKMEEEIHYRECILGPELLAEMKRTREFGDLSENAEYKEAKREKRKNEGRIRYLKNMIRTAKIIPSTSKADEVGLYDTVEFQVVGTENKMKVTIVTTFGHDSLNKVISKESPVGKAVLGKRVGDTASVVVNDSLSYDIVITGLEKGE